MSLLNYIYDWFDLQVIKALIACYKHRFPESRIYLVPNRIHVYWGHPSVLQADLITMRYMIEVAEYYKKSKRVYILYFA